jgi:hypothetical protein
LQRLLQHAGLAGQTQELFRVAFARQGPQACAGTTTKNYGYKGSIHLRINSKLKQRR